MPAGQEHVPAVAFKTTLDERQLVQNVALPEQVAHGLWHGWHTAVFATSYNPVLQTQFALIASLVWNPFASILFVVLHSVQAVGEVHLVHPIGHGEQIDPFL